MFTCCIMIVFCSALTSVEATTIFNKYEEMNRLLSRFVLIKSFYMYFEFSFDNVIE